MTAFVSIMMDSHTKEMALAFEKRLLEIPEIVSCHNISGRYDFLLEILARDTESFGNLPGRCCSVCRALKRSIRAFRTRR